MDHLSIIAYAEVAVGFAQLGLIGWGLRRWEKDTDKLRKQNERRRAERAERVAERAAEWAEISPGLAAATARLGEELAKGRA